jgi:hypothetical protein
MMRLRQVNLERRRMAVAAMTRPADHRITHPGARAARLASRFHGSLEAITDSQRRALRPIGTTAREVAERTSQLLGVLLDRPGLWAFQGIRPRIAGSPRIPHAIGAGRQLVLVESVAWPPGRYTTTAAGQIHCDGVYIGQSVAPLRAAIAHWQAALSPGHRVGALVVVHPTAEGTLTLPTATGALAWSRACDAIRRLSALLPHGQQPTSLRLIGELFKAAAEEESG